MPTIHDSKKSVQAQMTFAVERISKAQNLPAGKKYKCPKCDGKGESVGDLTPTCKTCQLPMLDSRDREIAKFQKALFAIREIAKFKSMKV